MLKSLTNATVKIHTLGSDSLEEHSTQKPSPGRRNTVSILVLGRSGSGKTLFVNACLGPERTANQTSSGRTIRNASYSATISNQRFNLIDTLGFDNTTTSNAKSFVQLANYLSDNTRARSGVTGVIYIHRAGDPLESRALAQNIKVLSKIVLGGNGLSRLTVLVVPANSGSLDSASAVQMITHPNSALRPLFPTNDHRITVSNFDQADLNNILMSYTSKDPILLRIQQNPPGTFQSLVASIEACLGYCENESVRAQLDWQARQYRAHFEKRIAIVQASLHEAQSAVSRYDRVLKQTEQQVKSHRDEIAGLRQQLQQTQIEYTTLRSQLQLQVDAEQIDIVQGLKDLNREIDDIGRSISEYLVDSYIKITFNKPPADVTTLGAYNLDELKRLLGHTEGNSSLISSSSGTGMAAEDFFDYSIRSMLCLYLCQQVFDPFHPGVDSSQNNFMKALYADAQQREPQAVAAKWRADSFKFIYKPDNPSITSQHVHRIAQEFMQSKLSPLISNFFGPKTVVMMAPRHFDRLRRLVQTAWDWNTTLKGDVVMLGDFHLTVYPPSSVFDPTLMDEFEPIPRQPPATSILGTISLGLFSSCSVGGARPPEVTIVQKALVATESVYAYV